MLPNIEPASGEFEGLSFSDFVLNEEYPLRPATPSRPDRAQRQHQQLQQQLQPQHQWLQYNASFLNNENKQSLQEPVPKPAALGDYQVASTLNVNDMSSMNPLIQEAITSSGGFRIRCETEVQALKSEQQLLESRRQDLEHKIYLETKMKEAALNMSRAHFTATGPSGPASPPSTAPSTSPTLGKRKSIFAGKKRVSKQAAEEAELCERRLEQLREELASIVTQAREAEMCMLRHSVGILAMTHPGSKSSGGDQENAASGATAEKSVGDRAGGTAAYGTSAETKPQTDSAVDSGSSNGNHGNGNRNGKGVQATPRMSRLSKSSFSHSQSPSPPRANGGMSQEDRETVDQLIQLLTTTLSTPTSSPGRAVSMRGRITHLQDLTKTLVRQYESTAVLARQREQNLTELKLHVQRITVDRLDKDAKFENAAMATVDDYAEVLETSVDKFAKRKQEEVAALAKYAAAQSKSTPPSADLTSVLDALELENIDLKNQLKDLQQASQSEIVSLKQRASEDQDRAREWQERSVGVREELAQAVKSVDVLTRQAVEHENERARLERAVESLRRQVEAAEGEQADRRMSTVDVLGVPKPGTDGGAAAAASGGNSGMSVGLLQQEFRRILKDVVSRHTAELRKEQSETRKAQRLLRVYKVQMGAATAAAAGSTTGEDPTTSQKQLVATEPLEVNSQTLVA